jgi:hypothetical protein
MKSAFLWSAAVVVVAVVVWGSVVPQVGAFQAGPRTVWNTMKRTPAFALHAAPNNNDDDTTRTTSMPSTTAATSSSPARATDVTITKAVKSLTPNVKSSTTLRSIDENIYNFNKAVIDTVYDIICFLYPVRGTERDFARFYVLETVARVPYFAYLSVMHLRGASSLLVCV